MTKLKHGDVAEYEPKFKIGSLVEYQRYEQFDKSSHGRYKPAFGKITGHCVATSSDCSEDNFCIAINYLIDDERIPEDKIVRVIEAGETKG